MPACDVLVFFFLSGGFLTRASTEDDNQTIRTEDFADKFQDTLIYPSSGCYFIVIFHSLFCA